MFDSLYLRCWRLCIAVLALLVGASAASVKTLKAEKVAKTFLKAAQKKAASKDEPLQPQMSYPGDDLIVDKPDPMAWLNPNAPARSVNLDLQWLQEYRDFLAFISGPHPEMDDPQLAVYRGHMWDASMVAAKLYTDNIGDKPGFFMGYYWTHNGKSIKDVIAYRAAGGYCTMCGDIFTSWLMLYQRMQATADFSYHGLTEHYFNRATKIQWDIEEKVKLALNAARVGACAVLLADIHPTVEHMLLKDFNGNKILKPIVNAIVYDFGSWHKDDKYNRNYQTEVEACIGMSIAALAAPVSTKITEWDKRGTDPTDEEVRRIQPDIANVAAYMGCVDASLYNKAKSSVKAVQHSAIVTLATTLFGAIPFAGCFTAALVPKLVDLGKKGIENIAKNAAGQLDAAEKGSIIAKTLAQVDTFEKLWLGIIEAEGVSQQYRRRAEVLSTIYNAKYMMIMGKNLVQWGVAGRR